MIVAWACASFTELSFANSYGGELGSFSDLFLRQLLTRLNDGLGTTDPEGSDEGAGAGPPPRGRDELDDSDPDDVILIHDQPIRVSKDYPGRVPTFRIRHDNSQNFLGPSIRDQEYLEHSSLWGHQYVQGGAGEGKQHLKPDGSVKNGQTVKTDAVLPAYCNPPNPCPIGYTAADGCLEEFDNTATFSRNYQSAQECMCDSEHMFSCPSENGGGSGGSDGEGRNEGGASRDPEMEIEALANSMQHEGLVDSALNRLVDRIEGEHKSLVAKKFFKSKVKKSVLPAKPKLNMRQVMLNKNYTTNQRAPNPYLAGEKLPVVAKKFRI